MTTDERAIELLEAILRELQRNRAPAERPEAMTIDEAAARMGCSRTRVFDLLRDGTLQRARRLGRHQMILASSIESAMAQPKRRPVKPARRHPSRRSERGGEAEVLALLRASRRQELEQQRADRRGA